MKKILILSGGFGSRLKPLVSEVPKPLAPVNGKPFLLYLIENLVKQGAKEFIFLLYYEANKIKEHLQNMEKYFQMRDVKLRFLTEKEPLGTGGALLYAIQELGIDDSFYVTNADTWLGSGLSFIVDSEPGSLIAIEKPDTKRYGLLDIDNGIIKSFIEKRENSDGGWINAGFYHFTPNHILENSSTKVFSLEEQVLPSLANKNELKAIKADTNFIDIGIPKDYERFCDWIKKGKNFEL